MTLVGWITGRLMNETIHMAIGSYPKLDWVSALYGMVSTSTWLSSFAHCNGLAFERGYYQYTRLSVQPNGDVVRASGLQAVGSLERIQSADRCGCVRHRIYTSCCTSLVLLRCVGGYLYRLVGEAQTILDIRTHPQRSLRGFYRVE